MQTDTRALRVIVMEAANYTRGEYKKLLLVVHDVESPEGPSWAEALMGPAWFQKSTTRASCQYMVDSDSIVQGTPELAWAWHCGSPGSKISIGIEQAGYARFTREQWNTPAMRSQRWLLAQLLIDIAKRRNIPLRYASDQDIRDAAQGRGPGGICFHRDITRVLGGTTHTDPGSNYPKDLLQADWERALDGDRPKPIETDPKPTPENPKPNPLDPEDEEDMKRLVLFTHKGTAYYALAGTGTYVAMSSPQHKTDFEWFHRSQGFEIKQWADFKEWSDGKNEAANPQGFGVEISYVPNVLHSAGQVQGSTGGFAVNFQNIAKRVNALVKKAGLE